MAAGHSLGAGVASLAAPWAALQWPGADVRCVTFGNPKPGNAAYARVRPTSLCVKSACCLISCSVEECFGMCTGELSAAICPAASASRFCLWVEIYQTQAIYSCANSDTLDLYIADVMLSWELVR